PLIYAGLVIDNPTFRRTDVKPSFGTTNNPSGRRFVSEHRRADGTECQRRENAYFAFHVGNYDYSLVFCSFTGCVFKTRLLSLGRSSHSPSASKLLLTGGGDCEEILWHWPAIIH